MFENCKRIDNIYISEGSLSKLRDKFPEIKDKFRCDSNSSN